MKRLALISDIHGQLPKTVPDADAIIIAGDLLPDGSVLRSNPEQRQWFQDDFRDWFEELVYPIPTYMTWGNHDWTQAWTREVEEVFPPGLHIIVDDATMIAGRKVWFSPWVPNLARWAWYADDLGLTMKYAKIPANIDIIVSHGPPLGAGDSLRSSAMKYGLPRGTGVGSQPLANRMAELPNLEFVICGHIHEDRGDYELHGKKVLNVASVDGQYEPYKDRWTILDLEDKDEEVSETPNL